MKLGAVKAYDFEKDGCAPEATFEDLNKKCLTTKDFRIGGRRLLR